MLWARLSKLRADAPHTLADGEPCGRREDADRPYERAPGSEDEADGNHDDALRAAADADVAPQAERLGAGARVAHEEGAGDGCEGEPDADEVVVAREDERDRAENDALADAVGRRVEEGAERGPLAARARERPVEDVEDRAHDEDSGAEPVEEDLVPVLEEDEDGCADAESDAQGRQRVRCHAGAREAEHRAAGDPAGALCVPALQARGPAHRGTAGGAAIRTYRLRLCVRLKRPVEPLGILPS